VISPGGLVRGQVNVAGLGVAVDSDGAWSVSVRDSGGTGVMLDATTGATLAAPMTASVGTGPDIGLAGGGSKLTTGVGPRSVSVTLRQSVGDSDVPGDYSLRLLFTAIAGF
jgi:hypothetical protein